jgi:hypothetical protein
MMAEVIIKEAEIIRLIPGYGVSVSESYKDKAGEVRKNYYTVWTKENLAVGDLINVRGLLTVKLDEYEKDGAMVQKASASVNNPTIEKVDLSF